MNWGTKLLIGMGLFMAFIIALGTAMVMSNDDALIEENYYEKGLNYDKDYNEQQNAVKDSVIPEFEVNNQGLTIRFPSTTRYSLVCKRLANAHLDQTFKGSTNEAHSIKFDKKALASGPWKLELEYVIENRSYKVARDIMMP